MGYPKEGFNANRSTHGTNNVLFTYLHYHHSRPRVAKLSHNHDTKLFLPALVQRIFFTASSDYIGEATSDRIPSEFHVRCVEGKEVHRSISSLNIGSLWQKTRKW